MIKFTIMNLGKTLLTLALVTSQVTAFSSLSNIKSRPSMAVVPRAAEVGADAFEVYAPGSALASKDVVVGTGEGASEGDVVTVSYVGYLYPSRSQFDKGEKYVFKIGGGKTMPGFDQGLVGAKVGGKRLLRIPPSLAYGEKGAGSKIPPNSDLEMEVEVSRITPGGIQGELALFGEARAFGTVACIAVMAFTPMVEKMLINM